MSVTDIRLSIHFFNDIKVKRLQAIHGDSGVLGLIRLWTFTACHRPHGILVDISDEEIQFITEVKAPEYLDSLMRLNLVERVAGDFIGIVNWERHQSWVINAPDRSEKAKRAAQARWDKRVESWGKNNDKKQ